MYAISFNLSNLMRFLIIEEADALDVFLFLDDSGRLVRPELLSTCFIYLFIWLNSFTFSPSPVILIPTSSCQSASCI